MIDETTLNELMDRNPLDLTGEDITRLVMHYRKQREAGPRPKKETGPTAKIDLGALGLKAPPPVINLKRRF